MSRAFQVLIALDQLVNAMLGGYADETISARSWRLRKQRPYCWLRPLIDWAFFLQPEHCKKAYESEIKRTQSPAEYQRERSVNGDPTAHPPTETAKYLN